ncbi:hypothetical protein POM88_019612 [Heracleum sosnowskyi]|uniref:SKP1 component POZ domain-containing protein n=1 Tax=Heracleum sosnowskyi TaxID=360622 RepID=A0AAD8I9W0_9APIA|nr:hypothetical protein POM88_019612 [Heracleum sosnowskyi]
MTYFGNDIVLPEKQLGTIKLKTGRGIQYLYKVDHADTRMPSIKYGDTIPLTIKGPTLTFDDLVYLDFDLFCGAFKGTQDLKEWEPYEREVSRERVLFQSVDGTGWVVVNIGRSTGALITNVKLSLINNPTAANVSGVVFAANSELDIPDCRSVLFLKNPGNEIKVGPDGVIPLSKSFVGVPVDCQLSVRVSLIINGDPHTSVLKFDPIDEGVVAEFIPNEKEAKIQIEVTWGVGADVAPIYDIDFIYQRKIKLWSADDKSFMVEEAVALEFHPLRDMIKQSSSKELEYCISGITGKILLEVIKYFRSRVDRHSYSTCFTDGYFQQHDLVTLFNLIQAAHHLQDKRLMDLTCGALANSVKTRTYREIMKMSNIDDASIQILTRTHSEEGVPSIDSILRQRGQETFINRMLLVDVPISSLAKKHLFLFKDENPFFAQCLRDFLECMESQNSDLEKLLKATKQLHDLIDKDAGLVDYLSFGDVRHLLSILREIDNNKDMADIYINIQSLAVRILSHVLSHSRFSEFSLPAAPALVRLLYNSSTAISIAGAMALTRLAFASHECYGVILHTGALEIAQKIVLEDRKDSDLIQWLAKFLAVICSRGLPPAKVKVVLAISKDLLLMHSFRDRHIVPICYALQFLTDRRHVTTAIAIKGETWNKLIKILVERICHPLYITHGVAGPVVYESIVTGGAALGVVGNIARWGPRDKVQTLADDSALLRCLRRMLCFEPKFVKEVCQIISNIAARSRTWIKVMQSAKLIEPLCSLLESDTSESDIKMEAAWAIFNGIYGDRCQKIDNYSKGFHVQSRNTVSQLGR